jgi:hypothetical protein
MDVLAMQHKRQDALWTGPSPATKGLEQPIPAGCDGPSLWSLVAWHARVEAACMAIHKRARLLTISHSELLHRSRDPEACAAWSGVDFTADLTTATLQKNTTGAVYGRIAGHRVGFEISVLRADEEELRLHARGTCTMDVLLRHPPGEPDLELRVAISPARGIVGRIVASAVDALASGGMLDRALGRLVSTHSDEPYAPARRQDAAARSRVLHPDARRSAQDPEGRQLAPSRSTLRTLQRV